MLELANQTRTSRIPPAFHPWPDDEPASAAKGISLGMVLGVGAWVALIAAGLAWALWL